MSVYLIVAYQTAGGRPLREAIEGVMGRDAAAEFRLLVPATRTHHLFTWTEGESIAVAEATAEMAAERLSSFGVDLTAVTVGDPDPMIAVSDELGAHPECSEIIVSTFPPGVSRWLRLDLPSRLQKATGLPITHVVVHPESASILPGQE